MAIWLRFDPAFRALGVCEHSWLRINNNSDKIYRGHTYKIGTTLSKEKSLGTTLSQEYLEIFVNKTPIIFHFVCQSSSNYVIETSTKNDSNLQKKCIRHYQSFCSHFRCAKILLLQRKDVKVNDWQAELQCSELCWNICWFVDKYLNIWELNPFHAFFRF